LIEDSEQAFAEIFQARQKTIEKFREVAEHVKKITNVEKKLNVSGGLLSLGGMFHFFPSFTYIFFFISEIFDYHFVKQYYIFDQ